MSAVCHITCYDVMRQSGVCVRTRQLSAARGRSPQHMALSVRSFLFISSLCQHDFHCWKQLYIFWEVSNFPEALSGFALRLGNRAVFMTPVRKSLFMNFWCTSETLPRHPQQSCVVSRELLSHLAGCMYEYSASLQCSCSDKSNL